MARDLLIHNGVVLAESQTISNGYVLVRDGKICQIGKGLPEQQPEEKIDAGGLTISPGFVDMHTHGIEDVDFMESSIQEMDRALSTYARYGATRVVPTTISNTIDATIAQMKQIRKLRENSPLGAMIPGSHMEGPWLAPRCRGGHAAEYLKHPTREDVDRVIGEVGDIIITLTYAPEVKNALWLTEQLSSHGIIPVLGHTEATFEQAEQAILAGARHVTHMYDASLGYKENPDEALVMMPGMETAVLMNDHVSIELIGCPVHVPKPFFRFINKIKPRDKKVVVTDSLVGTGLPEHTQLTYKDGRKVYVEEGVLRMIDDDPAVNGNLTGSAVTINVALRRLMEYADLRAEEAVPWVSLNPAVTLGISKQTGSIAIGKYADIVIMDDYCNVNMTMLHGKTVFTAQQ